jgi:hypothetical protein
MAYLALCGKERRNLTGDFHERNAIDLASKTPLFPMQAYQGESEGHLIVQT